MILALYNSALAHGISRPVASGGRRRLNRFVLSCRAYTSLAEARSVQIPRQTSAFRSRISAINSVLPRQINYAAGYIYTIHPSFPQASQK